MQCMRQRLEQGLDIPFHSWMTDVASGLHYLHDERIVHGDLRGANILIDDDLTAKLGDFGLSQFPDMTAASLGSLAGGAARWMAPEVMKGSRPSYASDIYAFGCVCLELHTGQPPFSEIAGEAQVIAKVLQGVRPKQPTSRTQLSPELWDLLKWCWRNKPHERPNATFLVKTLSQRSEALFGLRIPTNHHKGEAL